MSSAELWERSDDKIHCMRPPPARERLDPIASFVLSVAIAGNGFFIKRLVDEVDLTKRIALQQQEDIQMIGAEIAIIKARLRIAIAAKKKK